MALLENSNPKETSGGYFRLFGIRRLSLLMTKVQSTVISAGTELEKTIVNSLNQIDDLKEFLNEDMMPLGVFIATKKQIKKCDLFDSEGLEPDFLIFKRDGNKQNCYIIELKDGHIFDTKKATQERRCLYDFSSKNACHFPYVFKCFMCCFNADSKETIFHGMKGKISREDILTGKEFCTMFNIDYKKIQNKRSEDTQRNVKYFIEELLKIEEIKNFIRQSR